jgi:ribonuclease BN (tRNA processing enzyme)
VAGTVCLGYRLDDTTASLAYLPDVEYLDDTHRHPALELARGVDLLLHDTHYTTAEYPHHRGRGHACDRDAVEIAREAGARHLLLFHHHPDHTDASIDAMVACYEEEDFVLEGARQGREYVLGKAV